MISKPILVTASSRKQVKILKKERVKEQNMKIKEESHQRKHRTAPNVEQILLQQKSPSRLQAELYPEELLINPSSSAWLLLQRLGKRF